jgi:CheY-like chemotaxis protein
VQIEVELVPETETTLMFRVIDTGIGIQNDKFEVLFNAFQQADASIARKYGGTGLGLTISRTLIEMQNGKLDLRSKPNEGTEFFFTIPYHPASEEQVVQVNNDKKIDAAVLRGIKVLVAEDNEYNRIVVNDTLENLIPEVHIQHAENGMIALEMVQQHEYDVVLMDANMPEMDGLEATRQIRKLEGPVKDIPIIALTASVLAADIAKCIHCGMNDSVPKPFTREQLLAALMKFYRYEGPEPKGGQKEAVTETIAHPKESSVENDNSLINLKFLRDFCGGDEIRMRKYIDMFLKSLPNDIQRIESALEAGDHKTLKTVMHTMKPHFNFMGMHQTRNKADQVEELITNGHHKDGQISSLVRAILEDCEASVMEWSR